MNNGKPNPAWEIVGKATTVIVMLIFTAILRGLVLSALWNWYVQPLGVKSINVAEAIGLALLFGMMMQRESDPEVEKQPFWKRWANAFFVSVFGAGFAYLFGWIVHFFV